MTVHRPTAIVCVAILAGLATAVFSSSRRFVAGAAAESALASAADRDHPVPVLVELFTSEGCSSCPPADDVLTKLITTQPVPGAVVIGLGEHVDYWDRLGWRDAFSSAAFSARQSDYARNVFHIASMYTPQMVVDGREEFIGSDYRVALGAIARAAQALKGAMRLSLLEGTEWTARIDVEGLPGETNIMLAVVERDLATDVRRGENRGRRLKHSSVVRSLTRIGVVPSDSRSWSMTHTLAVSQDWNASGLQVVAFAQDSQAHRIVAAASTPLTR